MHDESSKRTLCIRCRCPSSQRGILYKVGKVIAAQGVNIKSQGRIDRGMVSYPLTARGENVESIPGDVNVRDFKELALLWVKLIGKVRWNRDGVG